MDDAAKRIMHYATNAELPEDVRHALPQHAQDLFRTTFNDAYERYGPGHEDRIRHLAWMAVKRHYLHHGARIWVARAS
jgi:cation transport regulator